MRIGDATVQGCMRGKARRIDAVGPVAQEAPALAQRIVTARHAATWSEADQLAFRRYAYPLSDEVFILWDNDPSAWAPQNHSCEPNTRFEGLDVVAARAITRGEELTLDYATFMNENGEPFDCHCGAASCRGMIVGVAGNTLTMRERGRRS